MKEEFAQKGRRPLAWMAPIGLAVVFVIASSRVPVRAEPAPDHHTVIAISTQTSPFAALKDDKKPAVTKAASSAATPAAPAAASRAKAARASHGKKAAAKKTAKGHAKKSAHAKKRKHTR